HVAKTFYDDYKLKRVYYSAYIPIRTDNSLLPQLGTRPPLVRESRLYQTDWLLRFYGFSLEEILNAEHTQLELDIDPKLSWALRNPAFFPVDINRADYGQILWVPGIGRQSALKIIQARKFGTLHEYQVQKMGIAFNRARHFMVCADSPILLGAPSMEHIKRRILATTPAKPQKNSDTAQLSLFE